MAPDSRKVMKKHRCLSFRPFEALFLESIGIKTYIEISSIWLEDKHKISSLFGLIRMGHMSSDGEKVMKKHSCQNFTILLAIWSSISRMYWHKNFQRAFHNMSGV